MKSFLGLVILICSIFATSNCFAKNLKFESKFWIWFDAIQIQLTDPEAQASVLIYMEYHPDKKDYLTKYEIDFIAKKGKPIPDHLLQFQDLKVLRKVLSFISYETTSQTLNRAPIRPSDKPKDPNSLMPSYLFLRSGGERFEFLGDPQKEVYQHLRFQLKKIFDRVLYHPNTLQVHGAAGSCSGYLVN